MTTFIDIHVLQTVPSSNINRDDTGSPKTAVFGGVRRARVSSQAWKRATRRDFAAYLPADDRGIRTRRLVADLVPRITGRDASISSDDAVALAQTVLTAAIPSPQVSCHITQTTEETPRIIAANIHLSPLYSGQIESIGAWSGETAVDFPATEIEYAALTWDDPEVEMRQLSLEDVVEQLAYDFLSDTHGGWENNDGDYGAIIFDVADYSITLDYNERYTATEFYSHEF